MIRVASASVPTIPRWYPPIPMMEMSAPVRPSGRVGTGAVGVRLARAGIAGSRLVEGSGGAIVVPRARKRATAFHRRGRGEAQRGPGFVEFLCDLCGLCVSSFSTAVIAKDAKGKTKD